MSRLSNAVQALEERRSTLEVELEKINTRLRSIDSALGANAELRTGPGRRPGRPPGRPAGKKTGTTRRWFEPGEAVTLMQRLIKNPMRPSEVIQGLSELKGYTGKLGQEAKNRFTWAATSAMKAAVEAKKLVKMKDGKLTVAGNAKSSPAKK